MWLRGAILLCVASISHGAGSMTNSWAVQVRSGGKEAADALASKYGFINLGLVSEILGGCKLLVFYRATPGKTLVV